MALEIVFWVAAGLIVYAAPRLPAAALARLVRPCGGTPREPRPPASSPSVSLIVAAYDEEEVIERKIANARALDYPAERLELVVASDGSTDRTAELARAAGADLVLELPRGGKVAALNAAVEARRREILAFSDANSYLAPDALRRLVAPLRRSTRSATPAARSASRAARAATRRASTGATRWRCARWSPGSPGSPRATAPIYAVRRDAYIELDPSRGQDIGFPFELTKRGWRARLRAGRGRRGEDGADRRGRVPAQAADDVGPLGRDAQVGDALIRAATAPPMRSRSTRTACSAT